MKFQQQIACLIFIPCLIVFIVGMIELQYTYAQMKTIISSQSDSYYTNEINQLKQVQKAIKLHLDACHQNIYIQLQSIVSLTLKMESNLVKVNPDYIPLSVSNLSILEKTLSPELMKQINKNNLSISSWFLKTIRSESDLDPQSKQYLKQQSLLDGIQRAFIYESYQSIFNQFHIVDIFRAYESTGFFQKIPSSTERNFVFNGNKTCEYDKINYDPRCRPWYINSKQKNGIILDPPQEFNTTLNNYYGTGFCAKILERQKGFQGSLCGRVSLEEFNNIIYEVNTRTSTFFTMHRDTRQITLFNKQNRTYSQFHISDAEKNPYFSIIPPNYEQLVVNLQKNYSQYNFASDENLVVVQLADASTVILSPITIIDKLYTTNYVSNLTLYKQLPFSNLYRYVDIHTPNVLNNAMFVSFQLYIILIQLLNRFSLFYQVFQILTKSEVLYSYIQLNDSIEGIYISFMIISTVVTFIAIVFIYYYSSKISFRLHTPIDKFLILFQSISAQDLLYIDIFQESDQGSYDDSYQYSQSLVNTQYSKASEQILADETDDTLKNYLTSKDTITLYNSFRSMFQMVRYSNYEYYKINYGNSLLKWIKSCNFFTKQNDKRAIGICYMNIGNIHFNCERYTEALEAYGQAILMANYELGLYSEEGDKNNQIHLESIKLSDLSEKYENFIGGNYRIQLLKLKFDRMISYSKALKMFFLHNSSQKCWHEYVKVIKDLIKMSKRLQFKHTIQILLYVDLSFGQMMLSKLKSSKKTISETIKIIKILNQNQLNISGNIYTQSNPNTPKKQSAYIPRYSKQSFGHNKFQRQSSLKNLNAKNNKQANLKSSQLIHSRMLNTSNAIFTQNIASSQIISTFKDKKRKKQESIILKKPQKIQNKNLMRQNSAMFSNYNNNLPQYHPLASPSILSQEQQSFTNILPIQSPSLLYQKEDNPFLQQDLQIGSNQQIFNSEQTIEIKNNSDQRITQRKEAGTLQQALDYHQDPKSKKQEFHLQNIQIKNKQQIVLNEIAEDSTILESPLDIKNNNIQIKQKLANGESADIYKQYELSQRDQQQQNSNHNLIQNSNRINNKIVQNYDDNSQQIKHSHSLVSLKYTQNNDSKQTINNQNISNHQLQNFFQKNLSNSEEVSDHPAIQNGNLQNQKNQREKVNAFKELPVDILKDNDSMNQLNEFFLERDEYEYNIPSDILSSYAMIQEARIMIEKGLHYDACETLTQIFEDHQIYLALHRIEAIQLIQQCFQNQGIESQELREVSRNLNKNMFYDISIIIDIYETELIQIAQGISSVIIEEIAHRNYDKIGLSVITDIIEVVLTPITQRLLNKAQIQRIILQTKILIEEYRENFYQKPPLYLSILSQINLLTSKTYSHSNLPIQSDSTDPILYKKFILCITQIDLWEDAEIHQFLQAILHFHNIELLIIDIRQMSGNDEIEIPKFFDTTNQSIIKLFKDATHLYSYLSNMRLCTESYGVPLIVEKFQSGFVYLREAQHALFQQKSYNYFSIKFILNIRLFQKEFLLFYWQMNSFTVLNLLQKRDTIKQEKVINNIFLATIKD